MYGNFSLTFDAPKSTLIYQAIPQYTSSSIQHKDEAKLIRHPFSMLNMIVNKYLVHKFIITMALISDLYLKIGVKLLFDVGFLIAKSFSYFIFLQCNNYG